MPDTTKPILALTMGDPAGVGPEVIARAWADPHIHESAKLFVAGHPEVLRNAIQLVGCDVSVVPLLSPEEVSDRTFGVQEMPIVNVCDDSAAAAPRGVVGPK